MIPVLSLPTWTKLMKAFRGFMRSRPWTLIEAQHIFGFCDPQSGRRYFCSVLGSGGVVTGFYVFPQEEGLFQYFDRTLSPVVDASLRQNMLAFTLGSMDELFDEEYDVYESQGYHFAKGKCFLFHAYENGYAPFVLNEEQAEVLLCGYEVLKQVIKLLKEDMDFQSMLFQDGDEMKIPFFTKDQKKWNYHMETLDSYLREQRIYSMDAIQFDKQDKPVHGTWEIGTLYMPAAIPSVHPNRYFYPKVLIVADREDNRIIAILTKEERHDSEVFISSFFALLQNYEYLPSCVMTRGREAFELFRELDTVLDVNVLENSAPVSIIDQIWAGFLNFAHKNRSIQS